MSLENVVRPAQLPDNQPAKQARYRRSARNWMPVIVRIQSSGSPQTASGSVNQTITYYHKRRPTEKSAGGDKTFLGFPSSGSFLGVKFP